mmetsp:Transcript_55540/g.162316  ORF Transcript_55540/g.162316 Transcript_55540/m.162316 type:complete len:205 (+) Transcript_55540:782-1396(+)
MDQSRKVLSRLSCSLADSNESLTSPGTPLWCPVRQSLTWTCSACEMCPSSLEEATLVLGVSNARWNSTSSATVMLSRSFGLPQRWYCCCCQPCSWCRLRCCRSCRLHCRCCSLIPPRSAELHLWEHSADGELKPPPMVHSSSHLHCLCHGVDELSGNPIHDMSRLLELPACDIPPEALPAALVSLFVATATMLQCHSPQDCIAR